MIKKSSSSTFIVVTVILFGISYIYWFYKNKGRFFEHFTNITDSIEEEIIHTYNEILQRDPSAVEIKSIAKDMRDKKLNFYTLRQVLVDSDEYQRLAKTQSNSMSPELVKMIADKDQLNHINEIFNKTLHKPIQSDLVLPYYDLYVFVFKYDDKSFRDMLLNLKYSAFEYEVLHTVALDRGQLFAIYDRFYGLKDIHNSAWWPSIPLRDEIDKSKFETFDNKEIWYNPLAFDEKPKANDAVSDSQFENAASQWEIDETKLGKTVAPPWKGDEQEEVTYANYIPTGSKEIVRKALNVIEPVYPSTASAVPIRATEDLPQPKAPLQDEPIGSSLSVTPLTLLPKASSMPLMKPLIPASEVSLLTPVSCLIPQPEVIA